MEEIYRATFEGEHVSISPFETERKIEYDAITSVMEQTVKSIDQMNTEYLKGVELAQCLAVLATNTNSEVWNDQHIVLNSDFLLKKVLSHKSTTYAQLTDYFSQHREVCETLNCHIRTTLVRDGWTDKAMTCAVYNWYCHSLKYPLVSDYLDVLIPPALLFVDSYVDSIKLKGIQCLYHIMNECGRTELKWHGRAQVIYDALQKLTYSRKADLLIALHPAMIKILKVVEMDKDEGFAEIIYCRLLGDMYLEDKIALRRSYVNSLNLYIKYLGRKVMKHLKLTMKVVLSYLENSYMEETRISTLQLLATLMDICQPRIHFYCSDITKHLLTLLVDINVKELDVAVQDEMIETILLMLKKVPDRLLVTESIDRLVSAFEANAQLRKSFKTLQLGLKL